MFQRFDNLQAKQVRVKPSTRKGKAVRGYTRNDPRDSIKVKKGIAVGSVPKNAAKALGVTRRQLEDSRRRVNALIPRGGYIRLMRKSGGRFAAQHRSGLSKKDRKAIVKEYRMMREGQRTGVVKMMPKKRLLQNCKVNVAMTHLRKGDRLYPRPDPRLSSRGTP